MVRKKQKKLGRDNIQKSGQYPWVPVMEKGPGEYKNWISPTRRLWMTANHYRQPHVNHHHFWYNA